MRRVRRIRGNLARTVNSERYAMNTNAPAKTIEQLKEELRVAQEELQKIERAKQEEIREAKYAEERRKAAEAETIRAATVKPWITAVAEALQTAGVTPVEQRAWGIKIGSESYPDPDLQIGVGREESRNGPWITRTSYTGRYILTVGRSCRDFPCVRYPSKKGGGFNVEKIVTTVTERIESKQAAKKREQEKARATENATELAVRVSKDLGFTDKYSNPISGTESHSTQTGGRGSGYRYWTNEAPKGKVFYRVGTMTVTPEQARVLHDALVKINSMEPKKEQA